ncbi:hypothetical protein BFP72_13210 [Reichenbachiella sp. 5M10]|uniref:hypothetical protein n=1 Tax=Reichenbachiella sp. 5M10 TaxID=1889772 RepID=UPI000C146094|nr:hypothetical protein [Reichenbachiella sp. 5M10]PIB36282.1 hypothetical protein BFP72_13210 [Reichenbachiella sp. 5M10]
MKTSICTRFIKAAALRSGVFVVLFFQMSVLHAQELNVYFALGGFHQSFQDTRFSDLQYGTWSIKPEIGFNRETKKSIITTRISAFFYQDEFKPTGEKPVAVVGFNGGISYLRGLHENWYLGGSWDIDYYSRDNEYLENGSNFYRTASDWFLAGRYQTKLKKRWPVYCSLQYSLFALINSAPSFTANFPQKVVDEGGVSFQDANSRNPWYLKDFQMHGFWDHLYIRMRFGAALSKRFGLEYSWDMRHYAYQKGYPITTGLHTIMIRWNFIHRPEHY